MEPTNEELSIVWDGKSVLGEGPVWDHRSGRLIWVDIMGEKVHMYDPVRGTERAIALGQKVGAAVPDLQGGIILAMEHGFHRLDVESEQLIQLFDPESDKPGNRFNDGKCDAAGRFWAGTMNMNERKPTGALYCLDTDGCVRKAVDGVTVSNGLAWSADNRTMYYIDTPTKRVVAYDFELEDGQLANPRTVIMIPDGEGFPDGMTIDTEGMLWIAQWDGWQVSRWNPHTGEKMASIPVPVAKPSSCIFGGERYDTLYITSARVGFGEREQREQPHAGAVFAVKPGITGSPCCFYGHQ